MACPSTIAPAAEQLAWAGLRVLPSRQSLAGSRDRRLMAGRKGRRPPAQLKADVELRRIPVVVLTTSAAESDISRSYELHANCFITKPLDLEDFFSVVQSIKDFWLASARLPYS